MRTFPWKSRSQLGLIILLNTFLTIVTLTRCSEYGVGDHRVEERETRWRLSHEHMERETRDLGAVEGDEEDRQLIRTLRDHRGSRHRGRRGAEGDVLLACRGSKSCKNRCSVELSSVIGRRISCHCDQYCVFFQDCCHDYHHYCAKSQSDECQQNTTQTNTPSESCSQDLANSFITFPNSSLKIQLNFFKCQPYFDKFDKAVSGVRMISDCPDKDHPAYDQCVNAPPLRGDTIVDVIPVVDVFQNVFRNKHCALCNRADIASFWRISMACNLSPPSSYTAAQSIDFLMEYCEKFEIAPPSTRFPLRFCLEKISQCSPSVNVSDEVTEGCLKGPISIVLAKKYGNSPKQNYKNYQCALCNGRKEQTLQCGPSTLGSHGGAGTPKSLAIVMDFTRDTSQRIEQDVQVKCTSPRQVYDPHLERCRTTMANLPVSGNYDEYKVIMWMKQSTQGRSERKRRGFRGFGRGYSPPSKPASVREEDFVTAISQHLNINSSQVSGVVLKGAQVGDEAEFKLRIEKREEKVSRSRRSVENANKLLEVIHFKNPFDIPIGNKTYLVYKAVSRHLTCLDTTVYQPGEYLLLPGGGVLINSTGFEYSQKEFYTDQEGGVTKVIICGSYFITNCSGVLIVLNKTEYTTNQNRSIYRTASQRLYEFWEYNLINGTVSVCVSYSRDYTTKTFTTPPPDDEALVILTIVGFSLSIICLVFVLVTYTLFAKLRTLPGKNIMNLASALLLALILWLAGISRTDLPAFCTAVAVLLNYLFLVMFSWSAVISYDTCTTFTQKGGPGAGSDRNVIFLRYLIGAWAIPLVFILTFLVLDKAGVLLIGYGTGDACWIAEPTACIYLMAVPIGLVLIFNAVFFIRTILAIKAASEVGQRARASGQRSERQVFYAATRLATLMGFTWIFGFAASWAKFLWYPFVILTSLQGVYIALAFTMNRRVLNMYLNSCDIRLDDSSKSGAGREGSTSSTRPTLLSSCRASKSNRSDYSKSTTEETKV